MDSSPPWRRAGRHTWPTSRHSSTIGIIWLNHRTLVDRIARFDARLHWLNLMLLLGVATLPWPTSLVAEYVQRGGADASAAAALYGLTATLMALPWGFIWRHLADRPELLEAGYDAAYAQAEWRRGSIGVPIYAVATLVALVLPLVALALYLAIAILYAVTSQGSRSGPRSRSPQGPTLPIDSAAHPGSVVRLVRRADGGRGNSIDEEVRRRRALALDLDEAARLEQERPAAAP